MMMTTTTFLSRMRGETSVDRCGRDGDDDDDDDDDNNDNNDDDDGDDDCSVTDKKFQ
jgi:hypothetical protein